MLISKDSIGETLKFICDQMFINSVILRDLLCKIYDILEIFFHLYTKGAFFPYVGIRPIPWDKRLHVPPRVSSPITVMTFKLNHDNSLLHLETNPYQIAWFTRLTAQLRFICMKRISYKHLSNFQKYIACLIPNICKCIMLLPNIYDLK